MLINFKKGSVFWAFFCVHFVFCASSVSAETKAEDGFVKLAHFLVWADQALAEDDYEALARPQLVKASELLKIHYLRKLDEDLGEGSLVKVFGGREFPKGSATFKLGGHFKELGCHHLDFVKKEGRWFLSRIWQCR